MAGSYLREGRDLDDLIPTVFSDEDLRAFSQEENNGSYVSDVWNNNPEGFDLYDCEEVVKNYSGKSTCDGCLEKLSLKINSLVNLLGVADYDHYTPMRIFEDGGGLKIISDFLGDGHPISYHVFFRDEDKYFEIDKVVNFYNSGEWEKTIDKLYKEKIEPLFDGKED